MLVEFRNNFTLVKKVYDQTLEPVCVLYSLTRMELDILLFLANNPGYDTATDIVEQKRFTKSHVSSSLKLLESKGYLERSYYPGNHKTVHLKFLQPSHKVVQAGQTAQREVFTKIFDGFSQEELSLMEEFSNKIRSNIHKAFQED